MKQSDIKVEVTYDNGHGREREVLDITNDGAASGDGPSVRYKVVKGPWPWGRQIGSMTLAGFARWAKFKVTV